MTQSSCSAMPSKVRRFFFGRGGADRTDDAPVKRNDFHKAAMLAASGYYAAEDYNGPTVTMDLDAVN